MKQLIGKNTIPGSGELDPVENGHDSWIMKQIETGEPIPSIQVEQGMNDTIRFAHKINRIALAIGDYNLRRFFHQKSDGSIAFFYSIKGSFEHATINQIKLIKELLFAKFADDYQTIFFESAPTMQRVIEAKISLQHSTIYLYSEIRFDKPWVPSEEFQEV